MGNKDASTAKPATTAAAPAEKQVAEAKTAEQGSATAATAAAETASKEAAAADEAAAVKPSAGKTNLYTVLSPIKHDGEDYAAGEAIRLPEATAHRLAGYLQA